MQFSSVFFYFYFFFILSFFLNTANTVEAPVKSLRFAVLTHFQPVEQLTDHTADKCTCIYLRAIFCT